MLDRSGVRQSARAARPDDKEEAERDRDIHRRAGERDDQLLARLFRHPLEPRDAADRQQRDVRRIDAEGLRRDGVAELVQQHAEEQQQDEEDALRRDRRAAAARNS